MEDYKNELIEKINHISDIIEAHNRIEESISFIETDKVYPVPWQLSEDIVNKIKETYRNSLVAELKKREKELEIEIKQYQIIKKENG